MMLIAHRGASGVAPEGTRAAIRAAVRAGAEMIELDLQLTRDGRLVVFHDDRLERTTNGQGRVGHTSYRRLARLDAGSWFHPRFAGERVLLAAQAARLIPVRMGINFELKRTRRRAALLDRFLRLVHRERLGGRLLVSSFDRLLLSPLRGRKLALALICHREPERALAHAIALGCAAWHPLQTLVTPRRIAAAHAAGLRVHAWTVDDPRRARRLKAWGVDGIFTNHPAALRAALG